MPEAAEQTPVKTYTDKKSVPQDIALILSEKGLSEKDSAFFSSLLCKHLSAEACTGTIKRFADAKNMNPQIGTTLEEEGEGYPDHTHNFAMLVLNYGDFLVGVTTKTSKGQDHVHVISLCLDSKIKMVEAYTDYSITDEEDDDMDFHRHLFSSDLYDIRSNIPSVYVQTRSYYYSEGKGSEDGVHTITCGKKKYKFSDQRQAEALLMKSMQMSERPGVTEKDIKSFREKMLSVVENNFPGSMILKVPSWWDGNLHSLNEKVRHATRKESPVADGKSSHYAIRFKDEGNAFFIFSEATDLEMAKNDAYVYSSVCHQYDVDVVKFALGEDGATFFSEIGSYVLYDMADKTKTLMGGSENPIKLSERDSEGNVVIEILRTGKFSHPQWGIIDIEGSKLAEIKKNFKNNVLDREVSFDFSHESELPASAWVRNLSSVSRNVKGNKQEILLAHVKFTPKGEAAVKDGDYRYFSSEYTDNFVDKETGKEFGTTLKGGGLTNRPFIPGLKPVELSEKKGLMGFIKN